MSDEDKKGLSGCAIAAIVVGIVLVLGLIGVGTCAALFVRSPAGQFVTEGVKATAMANKRPGTDELRAAGCRDAMVMDFSAMAALIEQYADGGVKADDPMRNSAMVSCIDPSTALSCEQVFKIYAPHAMPDTKAFMVHVTKANGEQACGA
jgi:hypothetical protein